MCIFNLKVIILECSLETGLTFISSTREMIDSLHEFFILRVTGWFSLKKKTLTTIDEHYNVLYHTQVSAQLPILRRLFLGRVYFKITIIILQLLRARFR